MIGSFHNHTTWSDGAATAAEMLAAAREQRIDVVGFSDHFCVYPQGGSPRWSMTPEQLPSYAAEIRALGGGSPAVALGLEIDWFPNHAAKIREHIDPLRLDFKIGSVHHVNGHQIDAGRAFWDAKTAEEQDDVFVGYYTQMVGLAEAKLFDIVAHFDLPKQYGHKPSARVQPAMLAALDAIAANGLILELNTSGFARSGAEGYPSREILRQAKQREVPTILSADAHRPENLTFAFDRGRTDLAAAGYRSGANSPLQPFKFI